MDHGGLAEAGDRRFEEASLLGDRRRQGCEHEDGFDQVLAAGDGIDLHGATLRWLQPFP